MAGITYTYFKKRHMFGTQPLFCEQGPELCDNISPDISEQRRYLLRNPIHENIQLGPIYSQQDVNTIRLEYVDRGMNHAEGGWPLDVNINDIESTQRYRRKQEKDDSYIHCVLQNAPVIEHFLSQNGAVELYEHYFKKIKPWPPLEMTSSRLLNTYNDRTKPPRPISSICWHPDGNKFAGTYVKVNYHKKGVDNTCYIWDVESNTSPMVTLKPPCALLDLQFSHRKGNTLIGGLMNGQVGAWDLRTGKEIVFSPIHYSHRDLVRKVNFISSKAGKEFFSGSADGACKWWDLRDMSEPTDLMIMDYITSSFQVPTMALANGVTALEYEPTIPTRFMVGTENGLVLVGNRKAKSNLEKIPILFPAHVGPVFSLHRNPLSLKNFLTVGTYNAKIWNEDCRDSATLWTSSYRHPITCGAWSPQRMSVFYLTHADGTLTCWDFLRNQLKPVFIVKICDEQLLRLACHENGHTIACGTDKGAIHLIDMSKNLTLSTPRDKQLFTQILDRESKREKILETRMREIKLKLRTTDEEGITPATLAEEPNWAVVDRTTTSEYLQIARKELLSFSQKSQP